MKKLKMMCKYSKLRIDSADNVGYSVVEKMNFQKFQILLYI
jgi:hypothetical protein